MDEFKSAMLDFLKFYLEQQKKNGVTPTGYTKRTAWITKTNKSTNKNSKKFYIKLNKSKETCLNWQTGVKLMKMPSHITRSGAQ